MNTTDEAILEDEIQEETQNMVYVPEDFGWDSNMVVDIMDTTLKEHGCKIHIFENYDLGE